SSQVQVQSTDRPTGVYPVNDQQSSGSPRGHEPATPVEKGGSNVRDDTSGDRSGDQRPEEDVSRAKDAALAADKPSQPIIDNPVDGQRDVGDEEQAQPGAGGMDQGGKGQDEGDEADALEDEEGSQVAKTVGDPCAEEGQGGDKGSAGSCLEEEERRRDHEEQGPADKATGEGDKRGVDVGDKGSASGTSGHNSEGGDQPDRSEDELEIDKEREPDGEQGKVQSDTHGFGGGEGTATPRTPENSNPLDTSPATPADRGRGADNGQSGTGAEQDSSSDDEEKEEDKPNAPHNTPADERQEGRMDVDEESVNEGPGKGSDEDDDEEEEEDKPSALHDSSADEVQGGGMDVDGESADEGGGRGPAATGKDKGRGGDGGECPFSVLAHD
ncbi:hypothetical protein DXG01_007272, partial [Tephrocybe rancida]